MRSDKASRTAIGVARAVAAAGHFPPYDRVLPESCGALTEALLNRVSSLRRWEVRQMPRPWYQRLLRWAERSGPVAGGLAHMALRKRFIDGQVQDAIHHGVERVVVLGSGLDVLAARLSPSYPAVDFVEVDHPATLAVKRRGYASRGALSPNHRVVPCDFAAGDDPTAAFEPDRRRTMVVAEGLLMYLSSDEVDRLFSTVRDLTAPPSRVVFSFVHLLPDGAIDMHRYGAWLRPLLLILGEPFRSGIAPDRVSEWLADRGYELVAQADDRQLFERYVSPAATATLLGLESFAVAETSTPVPTG